MLKIILPGLCLLLLRLLKKNYWQLGTLLATYFILFFTLVFYSPLRETLNFTKFFYVDIIRISLIFLSMWIFILILLARWKIFVLENRAKEFYAWTSSLNIVLILSFSLRNALFFYFRFERRLIPIIILILGWGYQPERLQARFYLILYTVTASLPLLIILLKIFSDGRSLNFFYLSLIKTFFAINITRFIWLLIILAFLVKIPIFICHLWLPKAHVEAPVAGSIILAGVLLKLGRYGFLRIASIFPKYNSQIFSYISSLSLWGAVVTRLICLRQVDIKALIAYSSVGHIGLLLAGSLRNNFLGWERSLLIILAHGICSSGLFITVNLIYEKRHSRRIFLTKGLLNIFPWLTISWFLIRIINIAAPPSINLAAELILVASIISCSNFRVFNLGIISFLAAAYRLFIFTATSHGGPSRYLMISRGLKSREYLNILAHLFPLGFLILKLDVIALWF